MGVKTSDLIDTPSLTLDDYMAVLDGSVLTKSQIRAILNLAIAHLSILASGSSVAAYAAPGRDERAGTTFLDHDGVLWLVNSADGTEGSQTRLLDLVSLALTGVDLLGAPQVRDAAELAADDLLSYQGDGAGEQRVAEGLMVYGAGGYAWTVIEETPSYTAHVVNQNAVNFREVGHRFSSLGRFQRAVLLGDAYPDGATVFAGTDLYVKDGTTGGDVAGWRKIPAGGALAALDTVTAAVLGDQSVTYAKLNNAIFAAQASAEVGTGTGLMTAERTAQAITAQRPAFGDPAGVVSHTTATRARNTTYQNASGRTRVVAIFDSDLASGSEFSIGPTSGALTAIGQSIFDSASTSKPRLPSTGPFHVPPGWFYRYDAPEEPEYWREY